MSVVIIEQLRDANAIGLMKLSEKFLDKQSVGVSTVRIYWLFVFFCFSSVTLAGALKMQDRKMQDWKMTDHIAGDGKCRTWTYVDWILREL